MDYFRRNGSNPASSTRFVNADLLEIRHNAERIAEIHEFAFG